MFAKGGRYYRSRGTLWPETKKASGHSELAVTEQSRTLCDYCDCGCLDFASIESQAVSSALIHRYKVGKQGRLMDKTELLSFQFGAGASDWHITAGIPPRIRVDEDIL